MHHRDVRRPGRGVELPPASRVPATVDTPFDLASVTKLFTAVAAMQQIERGTLGIDARVGAYLPDFRAAARHGITVRQLLTHTSGLRPELPLYDRADDADRLAMLRAEAPVGEAGTYLYSDLNLLLLQFVLERVSGRTLDVLVHDGITRPLGMASTDFGSPAPSAAWRAGAWPRPAGSTQPMTICSMAEGSAPDRSTAARTAAAPSSVAFIGASTP